PTRTATRLRNNSHARHVVASELSASRTRPCIIGVHSKRKRTLPSSKLTSQQSSTSTSASVLPQSKTLKTSTLRFALLPKLWKLFLDFESQAEETTPKLVTSPPKPTICINMVDFCIFNLQFR
ncbi:hypothetical protein M758_7G011300, partial [Ceratodon purpureus]